MPARSAAGPRETWPAGSGSPRRTSPASSPARSCRATTLFWSWSAFSITTSSWSRVPSFRSDLASRVGLTQTHISGIESGKIVPRYDTLLELVRILDHDLLMVPRALVPVVQSLIRDHLQPNEKGDGEERSLYADDADNEGSTEEPRDEV